MNMAKPAQKRNHFVALGVVSIRSRQAALLE
jgi:hypothetical protein